MPPAQLEPPRDNRDLLQVDLLGDEELRDAAHGASMALVQGRLLLGRCLLEIQRRDLWAQWGFSGLNHFVSLALKTEVREGKDCRRVARALEDLPRIAEAAEAGLLGWGNLREVVRVATPEDEAWWLHAARTRTYSRLCRMIQRFKDGADPDGPDFQDCLATRIRMDLLPEEAEVFQAGLAVLSSQAGRLLQPREAVVDLFRQVMEGRLRTTAAHVEKTQALLQEIQLLRRAQGEVEIEAVAGEVEGGHARVPSPESPGPTPEPEPAPEPADTAPSPDRLGGASLACEPVEDPWVVAGRAPGIPWAAAAVDEAPVPGSPDLWLAFPTRRPTWEGTLSEEERRSRFPTEALKRWISRRDGFQCACPGCPNTAWLRQHHVVFYCRGGLTVPENLVLCCSACHRNIHRGRLFVRGDAERSLSWRDRRGRELGAWTPAETRRAAATARRVLEEALESG